MTDTVIPLVLDLLEWLAPQPRPYSEVMSAWRTSCPRLPVWEDANELGLIMQRRVAGQESAVELTNAGRQFLAEHRKSTWRQ